MAVVDAHRLIVQIEASAAQVLDAISGSFTLTGSEATYRLGERCNAEAGAFSLTGSDAFLFPGKVLPAQPTSFTITGSDAELRAGWLSDWYARFKVVIDNTNIDSDLTHFPVPIPIDDPVLFSKLGNSNKKLAVTLSDGVTQINVEVGFWDAANEFALLWASKSNFVLTTASPIFVFIYFDETKADNTSYVGEVTDTAAQAVWTSALESRYGFSQEPNGDVSGTIKDSTSKGNHLTPSGSMTSADLVDGNIGKAIELDGSNDYLSGNVSTHFNAPYSVSVLFNLTVEISANQSDKVLFGKEDGTDGFSFLWASDSGALRWLTGGGGIVTAKTSWSADTWFVLQGVQTTASFAQIWVDLNSEVSGDNNYSGYDITPLDLGHRTSDPGGYLAVKYGEARYYNTNISDAWRKAEYYSLKNDFLTVGQPEGRTETLFARKTTFSMSWPEVTGIDIWNVDWLPGYRYRHRVTLDGVNGVPSALTHFPVPMGLTDHAGITNVDVTAIFDVLGIDGANKRKIAVTEDDGTTQLYVDIWGWCLDREEVLDEQKDDRAYRTTASSFNTYPFESASVPRFAYTNIIDTANNQGWRSDNNGAQIDGSCWLKINNTSLISIYKIRLHAVAEIAGQHDYVNSFPEDIGIWCSITGEFSGEETHIGDFTLSQPTGGGQPCDWVEFSQIYLTQYVLIEIYSQQSVPGYGTSSWVGFRTCQFGRREIMATLMVSRSDYTLPANDNSYLYLYYDPDIADNTTYVGDISDGDTVQSNVWKSHYYTVLPWIGHFAKQWKLYEGDDAYHIEQNFYDVAGPNSFLSSSVAEASDSSVALGRALSPSTYDANPAMKSGWPGNNAPDFWKDIETDGGTYIITVHPDSGSLPFQPFTSRASIIQFRSPADSPEAFFGLVAHWSSNKLKTVSENAWNSCPDSAYVELSENETSRIAFTWDDGYFYLYKDGVLVDTAGPLSFPTNTLTDMRISPTYSTSLTYHNIQFLPGYVLSDAWIRADGLGNVDKLLTWNPREDNRELHAGSFQVTWLELKIIYAELGAFSLTGSTASLNIICHANAGSFVCSGTDASLDTNFNVSVGSFVLTGSDAYLEVVIPEGMTVDPGSYIWTGSDAALVNIQDTDPGNYTITGTDLSFQHFIDILSGALVLTGTEAGLMPSSFPSEAGSYSLTGSDVGFHHLIAADSGSYSMIFVKTYRLYGFPGEFLATGTDVQLFYTQSIDPDPGFFSITGSEVLFNRMSPEGGSFGLSSYGILFGLSVGSMQKGSSRFFFVLTGAEDGTTDIEIPTALIYATLRSGHPTYLRVMIPGIEYAPNIVERKKGTLKVDLGYYNLDGGLTHRETIIEANLNEIRINRETANKIIVLSGHKQKTFTKKSVILQGTVATQEKNGVILSYEFSNPNIYLKPGDDVTIENNTFEVDKINLFINSTNSKMEVFAA